MLFLALSLLFIFPALCTGEFTKNVYNSLTEFRDQMAKALVCSLVFLFGIVFDK